jgi:hypothetical protein
VSDRNQDLVEHRTFCLTWKVRSEAEERSEHRIYIMQKKKARPIKSNTVIKKLHSKRNGPFFLRKIYLNLGKKPVNFYTWGIAFYGIENWTLQKLFRIYIS